MQRHARLVLAVFVASVFAIANANAQSWKPSRNVEIIVGSAAGGGADLTGRLMQKLFHDQGLVDVPVSVVNKTGGGRALSYGTQSAT